MTPARRSSTPKADELLTKIDTLGRPAPGTPVNCAAVDDVKASGSELLPS